MSSLNYLTLPCKTLVFYYTIAPIKYSVQLYIILLYFMRRLELAVRYFSKSCHTALKYYGQTALVHARAKHTEREYNGSYFKVRSP